MKHTSSLLYAVLHAMPLLAACVAAPMACATPASVELAGNAFITSADKGAVIGEHGLTGWSNPATVASTYFRVAEAGPVQVALDASLADGGNSTVRVKINGTSFDVRLAGKARKTYAVGTVHVPAAG